MEIHPSIAALRSNPAAQRSAQARLESAKLDWLDSHSDIFACALQEYGKGAELAQCGPLEHLFRHGEIQPDLVGDLVSKLGQEIKQFPLGQIPLRHQYRRGVGVLQLAAAGRADLSLLFYEAKSGPPPESAYFTDSESTEIVLNGAGRGCLFTIEAEGEKGAVLSSQPLDFQPGSVIAFAGHKATKLVEQVPGSMVVLRLSRTPLVPQESKEYRLSDGVMIHRASGDRSESRQEMFLALLGAMKRVDAVTAIAEKCFDGTPHLRWQAIRQMISLDTARGFDALCKVAAVPDDPLSVPAAALKTELTRSYPILSRLETA